MNYSPLVMITLKHSFYDGGGCPDFTVVPNPNTARLLNNHRCIVKSNIYGLSVYVPVDNQQPLIHFTDNSLLSFDLTLKTGEFSLYTDQRFELSSPDDLQVYQAGFTVKPEQDILTTAKANEPLLSIAIQRDFNQIKAIPDNDEIRFFAKPVLWFYYLVTDSGNSEQLAIVDVSQDPQKTTWQRYTPLEGDSIYAQLVRHYPAMAIVCFVSEQALACRESCAKHLQLKLGEHIVFEQLPGPSYRNYFHIETKTGSKPTDAIYAIVNYFTNTTLIKG
ncbi:MAG: hypothetical protein M0Q44_06930 [Methylobacter sp.]|jgi:hypothetical protein|nr:hypothetical protein [Methylobacter sp.]